MDRVAINCRSCKDVHAHIYQYSECSFLSKFKNEYQLEIFVYIFSLEMQQNEIYVLVVIDQKNTPVGVLRMHDLMQSGLV